jgi:hypothetical protein
MKTNNEMQIVSAKVPAGVRAKLLKLASKKRWSLSQYVRLLLEEHAAGKRAA